MNTSERAQCTGQGTDWEPGDMDTETYVLCQGKGSLQSILQQQQVPGEQCEREDAQTHPLTVPSSSSPSAAAQLHI